MRSVILATFVCISPLVLESRVSASEPSELVGQVITAVGGEDKLLKLFRIRERLNVSPDPEKAGNERTSILEPPRHWWQGKRDRVKEDKEPATYLVWAWTLGILTDRDSRIVAIPEVVDGETPLVGLRVSGTVDPPLDLYFDKGTRLLARVDWRSDIHRFSDWSEHDGVKYPTRCVGYKKNTGKPWYFTEILELERLTELPEGLSR